MAQLLRPDICVIGAGTGGLTVASAAAAFGVPVVLIENNRKSGEHLDDGCLPAKALSIAAERVNVLRNGARFGLRAVRFGVDFAGVSAYVRDVADAVAPQGSRERFRGLGVHVMTGTARFTDRRTLTVGDVAVRARRFVIATGSSPAIPAVPGLAETPHFTTTTVFELTDCPRHLIVLGAGAVGLELAQSFRRLGAEVTVLETATPLAGDDPECAAIVLDALAREGITVRSGVQIGQVRRALARVQVVITASGSGASRGEETIEGTHLLVAAGRRPNFDDLALDAAGIRHDPHCIPIDRHLRTSNKRVYAIGDVTGGPKSAHAASHHAGLVVRHALFRTPVRLDPQAIPSVAYTDPELAQVGLLEDAARARAGAIRVLRWPFRENDRARITGATSGHIKVITDRRGDILGATIVGAKASENIATWALAIDQKLNIRAFADLIVPYPTYAEVGKRAAMTYFTRGLTSPLVRRIMGWLRRLG